MEHFLIYLFLIFGVIQLKCNFVNCIEYDIYIKGYIKDEGNGTKLCSGCKVLISLINTNSNSDVIYRTLSEYVKVTTNNTDGRSRQYFELFKKINGTKSGNGLSFFKFIDIKKMFGNDIFYLSFLHISINTKFARSKKKRYQSIVYPNGEKTLNPILLAEGSKSTKFSTLFYLNKLQTIKLYLEKQEGVSNLTFMEIEVLYRIVDSLVHKRRLIPKMANLKKEAKKYDAYVKANQFLVKRYNFWVEFVNFFRSKFSLTIQSSMSPFY